MNINLKEKKSSNDYEKRKLARYEIFSDELRIYLKKEKDRPHFDDINKKRIFEDRYPLRKEINCKPHFTPNELFYQK